MGEAGRGITWRRSRTSSTPRGVDDATVRVLDGLRKQRNLAGYEGDLVTEAALAECLKQAAMLLARAEQRLREEGWIEREPR